MLAAPCRAVQIAALHGIGHSVDRLDKDIEVERAIREFVRDLTDDPTLRAYAAAARQGSVQQVRVVRGRTLSAGSSRPGAAVRD
jgi:hypothetical protein